MFAFILSRILQAIPVLLVVGFIAFAMFAYIGDPVASMLGQDYTEAQRVALVHQLGLSSCRTCISSGRRCTAISASASG
jgi:peptide/nickel transport system permease protein